MRNNDLRIRTYAIRLPKRRRCCQEKRRRIWEAYSTGGRFGFPDKPFIVFNCLTDPTLRARSIEIGGFEADAERKVQESSKAELLALFEKSQAIR